MENSSEYVQHAPWNKGVIVGQKSPFKLKEIWAIRVRLQLQHRVRELAMFDLGLDSKLRACDLVKMRVRDICHGEHDWPAALGRDQVRRQADLQPFAHGSKNGRQVVHIGIASGRQHPTPWL